MIVVDTNIIAYLFFPNDDSQRVEELLLADSNWVAPALWRSELRNVLATYLRQKIIDFNTACNIQNRAEFIMEGSAYSIDSLSVLALADKSGCSAYDCEFVALAEALEIKLISADKKLIKNFPDQSIHIQDYFAA